MNKGLIALLAACTLLFGCASQRVTPEQQALNELKWDYAENAIVLNFSASKDLNQYAGQSHNLLVVITQFDQANAIAPYIAGPQQLSNLLVNGECAGRTDQPDTGVFAARGDPKPCAWHV